MRPSLCGKWSRQAHTQILKHTNTLMYKQTKTCLYFFGGGGRHNYHELFSLGTLFLPIINPCIASLSKKTKQKNVTTFQTFQITTDKIPGNGIRKL